MAGHARRACCMSRGPARTNAFRAGAGPVVARPFGADRCATACADRPGPVVRPPARVNAIWARRGHDRCTALRGETGTPPRGRTGPAPLLSGGRRWVLHPFVNNGLVPGVARPPAPCRPLLPSRARAPPHARRGPAGLRGRCATAASGQARPACPLHVSRLAARSPRPLYQPVAPLTLKMIAAGGIVPLVWGRRAAASLALGRASLGAPSVR